jgi:hypothetical protein
MSPQNPSMQPKETCSQYRYLILFARVGGTRILGLMNALSKTVTMSKTVATLKTVTKPHTVTSSKTVMTTVIPGQDNSFGI